jgi:hypothetical protein
MTKLRLVALTTPLPGREADYHEWYQNVHLPELVNLFQMEGAQRFELVAKLMGQDENQYLAIYELEADDPMSVLAKFGEAAQSGSLTQSDAQDFGTTYTALFKECGERVVPN